MTEEWQHVARRLGALYSNADTDLPAAMREPAPGDRGFDTWAEQTFGSEAEVLIAAFDAIIEFRWPQRYVMGVDPPSEPADDDIERVARRMARSHARDLDILPEGIDGVVDRQWPNYRDAATEHLNQLRSGNA